MTSIVRPVDYDASYPPSLWGGGGTGPPTPTTPISLQWQTGTTRPPDPLPGHVKGDPSSLVWYVDANLGAVDPFMGGLRSWDVVRVALSATPTTYLDQAVTARPTLVAGAWNWSTTNLDAQGGLWGPPDDTPVTFTPNPAALASVEVEPPQAQGGSSPRTPRRRKGTA